MCMANLNTWGSDMSTIATDAADLAVKKVFYLLGVDVEDAQSVEEFREDLRFGRKIRKLADHGMIAIVGLIALGIVSVFWAGANNLVKH